MPDNKIREQAILDALWKFAAPETAWVLDKDPSKFVRTDLAKASPAERERNLFPQIFLAFKDPMRITKQ